MIASQPTPCRPHHRGWWGRQAALIRQDDGGSAAIEFVIVVPVALAVLFLAIQVALYSYARSIALTAAQEGANAERAYGAPAGAGQDKAAGFLTKTGDGLRDGVVDVQAGATNVTVKVTGRSLSVIPFFGGFTVTQSASGARERFVE
jgi:Flp pilus assembly protein TadG